MKHIPTNDAKEQFLELIDQLDDEGLVITKEGKPIAKLTKYEGKSAHLIGCMKGEIEILGDIYSTGRRWEATDWEPDGQS